METGNLPSFPTPFVGRDDELTEIGQLLTVPSCRLLTLVGPGGIGKTRLALEAARQFAEDGSRLAARFPNGIHFVPLQPTSSPEFIIPTIAEAIHFQFHQGSDPKQQLLDYLSKKSMLLILDNLEQLADGLTFFSELLGAAPNVSILATSRERLNLLEEWMLEIPALTFPVSKTQTDLEGYSAVQLFVLHACRLHISFRLDSVSAPDVIRICRLVGGIPLGIELAAAWVRVLPCEAIADEIERSLDILSTSVRNVEPRHQTMRAAFEPTWARLPAAEREVFKRLSVFRGGFTREAAAYVAGASLVNLSALVDKSLLRVSANGRCDIHELLRQYADEQLSPHEREATHERHGAYYAEFLYQRWEPLKGKHQKRALEEIDIEIDNVRASWHWATAHQYSELIDNAMDSLWFYYDTRGLYQEAWQAFQAALESVAIHGKSLTLGKLLARQGGFYFSLMQSERARSLLEESLVILRQHDAPREVGFALLRLSEVTMFHEGNPTGAKGYLQECLLLFQNERDSWGIAYTLRWLGFAALLLEDFEEAKQLSLESRAIYQVQQDQAGIAVALSVVGLSALGLGNYEEAQRTGQESVALCREIGLKWAVPLGLVSMAGAACALGEYHESTHCFYDALSDTYEHQLIDDTLWVLVENANLWIALGKPELGLAILAFSIQYPIPITIGKTAVLHRLAKLEAELPTDVVKTAKARWKPRDLDAIVQEVLAELKASQAALSHHSKAAQTSVDALTERELEVLHLIAEGMSNQQIAAKLVLAVGTVKFYTSQIYGKLHVENRIQALARARDLKLLA